MENNREKFNRYRRYQKIGELVRKIRKDKGLEEEDFSNTDYLWDEITGLESGRMPPIPFFLDRFSKGIKDESNQEDFKELEKLIKLEEKRMDIDNFVQDIFVDYPELIGHLFKSVFRGE